MVLYELLTGARPFEEKQNVQEINKAITTGNRPEIYDFNSDPAFSGMIDLMYDCWRQAAMDRPTADQVHCRLMYLDLVSTACTGDPVFT